MAGRGRARRFATRPHPDPPIVSGGGGRKGVPRFWAHLSCLPSFHCQVGQAPPGARPIWPRSLPSGCRGPHIGGPGPDRDGLNALSSLSSPLSRERHHPVLGGRARDCLAAPSCTLWCLLLRTRSHTRGFETPGCLARHRSPHRLLDCFPDSHTSSISRSRRSARLLRAVLR